jgi:hypothetical protein
MSKYKFIGYVLGRQHFLLSRVDLNKQPSIFRDRYPATRKLDPDDLVYTLNQYVLVGSRPDEDDENKFILIVDRFEKGRWDFSLNDVFDTREEAIINILKKKKALFDIVFSEKFQ